MRFRNPWIDPRVAELRSETVRAYLRQHGWSEVGPAEDPTLLRFERTTHSSEAPTLFVPLRSDTSNGLQWMIELVGDLATWQDRFAGAVLSDLLSFDGHTNSTGSADMWSAQTTDAT
jgi:hypothetical protein